MPSPTRSCKVHQTLTLLIEVASYAYERHMHRSAVVLREVPRSFVVYVFLALLCCSLEQRSRLEGLANFLYIYPLNAYFERLSYYRAIRESVQDLAVVYICQHLKVH